MTAHQELGHVKSQILDKAESMLGQWSHGPRAGRWLLRVPGGRLGGRTQGDQHHLAAVVSYDTMREKQREIRGEKRAWRGLNCFFLSCFFTPFNR